MIYSIYKVILETFYVAKVAKVFSSGKELIRGVRVAGGKYSVRQKTYKTNVNILRRYLFGGGRWRVAATL